MFLFSFGMVVHNAFADTVVATIDITSSNLGVNLAPQGVGVNPDTNMIYVTSKTALHQPKGLIFVINGATNSVTGNITDSSGPESVGANPTTNEIYVSNNGYATYSYQPPYNGNTVSVINGATNTVTTTINVGTNPLGVAVNPSTNKIYVSNSDSNTVSVIDSTTNTVLSTIQVGSFPLTVAVNPSTNRIYVSNYASNTVSVIDGATNTVVSTIPVGSYPSGVDVNSNTNKIYVTNTQGNSVTVIDGTTNSIVSTIPIGSSQPGGIAVNPVTDKIYVGLGNGTITIIDGATDKIIQMLSLGKVPAGIGVDTNTNKIYIAASGASDSVFVIDGRSSNTSTAPSAPTNLSATVVSPSQINLSWTAPTNNGGSAVTGYKIERSTDGGTTWNTIVSNSSHSWYSDYFLSASTTYTYRVSAINVIGTSLPSSTASATTSPATIPDPPRYLTPTVVSPSQINLSWWKPVKSGGSAITGYKIESSTDGGTTWNVIIANTGSALYINHYTNYFLSASTTYTYRVSAINAIGTSLPSSTASATTSPATVPDPPRYLTPTVVSPSQINLSWWKPVNSGGSAITGYKIESSTDGGTTWNVIIANTGSALYINHYSNTGLLPSTSYTYRVSTINAIGTSLPSSTASATTSPAT